jgi:hypothetical protein
VKERSIRQEFGGRIHRQVVILAGVFRKDAPKEKRPGKADVMGAIARLHEAAMVYFGEDYAHLIEERQLERYKTNRRKAGKAELPTIEEIAQSLMSAVDSLAMRETTFSESRGSRKLRLIRRKFGVCVKCGEERAVEGGERCVRCEKL